MVPGYMSRAPHSYGTDRLCLVLSGTWWVNSGADFDPNDTVPAPAGGFVRRVANTPHYDGVKQGATESAVIGIFGLAPVDLKLVYAPTNTLCVSEDLWRRFCKMGCISNGDPTRSRKMRPTGWPSSGLPKGCSTEATGQGRLAPRVIASRKRRSTETAIHSMATRMALASILRLK